MLQSFNNWLIRKTANPGRSPLDDGLAITIRFAYPDDEGAVMRLAALDSQPVPAGTLLVAEVDGELWAAVAITGERASIADPFHHTSALVELLHERAQRLTRRAGRPAAGSRRTEVAWR